MANEATRSPGDGAKQSTFAPPALPDGRMLIGGEWVWAQSGNTIDVFDPATERRIGAVARGAAPDIDRAVQAATKALRDHAWTGLSMLERELLINRLASLIERHADELAAIEAYDNGKPITLARHVDVDAAIKTFRYFAGWPSKLQGSTIAVSGRSEPFHAYTLRQPVGVVGQIIPWNFPLVMAAWKLAPALAAGCTIVLKPAEQTPYTALRLGQLIIEAGFPPGVVNIVTGFGGEAGEALVDHAGVAKIAFTGSTVVGKTIAARAGAGLKRVSLELGGKSPVIIMDDADLNCAIAGAANACFFNSGQVCFAGTRLFAPRNSMEKIVAGVVAAAAQMPMGPGLDPASMLGPLVSQRQLERVLDKIDRGQRSGAALAAGGRRSDRSGYFVEPTIAITTDRSNPLFREEVFGPVLTVTPYDDLSEIADLANDSSYGLGAYVYTRNLSAAHRLAAAIDAGTIWVNCQLVSDPALPFGGLKESGIGRENGAAVLDHYTELKTVCIGL